MDRRLSAVLTHVLAGHTRHRRCRSYGATLTWSATRPRLAGAGAPQLDLWHRPSSQQSNHDQPGHDTQQPTWAVTHDRGLAGGCAAESPPAGPSLGGSRSAERGCTGRAGRCSRPGRRFGCRRRRAPSVRRRRRGVCQCASAQPCLDCSPPKQGKRCSASPYPPVGSLWSPRVGRRLPGSSARVVLGAVVGAGLAGRGPKGSAPPGPTWSAPVWHPPGQPRSAGRSRDAGVPASRRAARPSIRDGRSPGHDRVACSGGRQ